MGTPDPRLKNAYRMPPKNGWTYVHLEGAPSEIGFQHGWLISKEIEDGLAVQEAEAEHDLKTVSYTHLDVYKRQVWARRSGMTL